MENIYLKTKRKETCNGCTACAYICPKKCIEMKSDDEGFIYPVVDESKCIHCGKCLTACSNTKEQNNKIVPIPYAIINNNENVLLNSTSGGVFYALLKELFSKQNAVCYGAAYDDNLVVRHMRAETLEDSLKFMGSKYVRSDIEGIYEKVKEDLKSNKKVLFTATPCETQGLYTYLKRDYDNLLTCDIICHSNPSPKVLAKYIKCLELQNNTKVKKITFRSKSNGWSNPTPVIELESGRTFEETTYSKAFSRVMISRPCCSECVFTKPYKVADITIGDFWGVEKLTNIKDWNKGTSLVLANNKKGQVAVEALKGVTKYELDNSLDYFMYNHHAPEKPHRNRDKFFKKLDNTKDEEIINLINEMSKERLLRRIIKKFKK